MMVDKTDKPDIGLISKVHVPIYRCTKGVRSKVYQMPWVKTIHPKMQCPYPLHRRVKSKVYQMPWVKTIRP